MNSKQKQISFSPFVWLLFCLLLAKGPTSYAQISWGDAGDIAVGQPIKASGLIEMREEIQQLRADVDAGDLGAWLSGAGNDIYYNAGDVGIGVVNPDVKLDVSGQIEATGTVQAGTGGGGVALTINDGYGNANIAFNHEAGRPEQNGNAARIEVNTDDTSNARMFFELGSGVTSGAAVNLNNIMTLEATGHVGIGTTDPAQKLTIQGPADVSAANAGGGFLIQETGGATSGRKLRIDDDEMQSSDDNAASGLLINPFGGTVAIGNTGSEVDVQGRMEVGAQGSGASTRVMDIRQNFSGDGDYRQIYSAYTVTGDPTANRSAYGAQFDLTNNRGTGANGDRSSAYGVRGYANTSANSKVYYNTGGSFEGRNSNSSAGMTHLRGVVGQALNNGGSTAGVDYAYGVEGISRGRTGTGAGPITNARGTIGVVYPYNSNVINAKGVQGQVHTNNSYSGNVTEARGVEGYVRHDSDDGATMTVARAGHFEVSKRGTAPNIGTAYGVWASATGADTNYGIYSAAGTNYFAGNVGIGTTNPSSKLTVDGDIYIDNNNRLRLGTVGRSGTYNSISKQSVAGDWAGGAGGNHELVLTSRAGVSFVMDTNAEDAGASFSFGKRTTPGMDGYWATDGGFTELLVIKGEGNVGIGTIDPQNKLHVQHSSGDSVLYVFNTNTGNHADGINVRINHNTPTMHNGFIIFRDSANDIVGSVHGNGSGGVNFLTTSDARLKENVIPTAYGLEDLMKLQVRDFNFKAAPDVSGTGFIAQELYKVYPPAVNPGGADEGEDPWTVDYGNLTPLLAQSVQDLKRQMDGELEMLRRENQDLRQRLDLLES